jgi:ATP synthase protein I
VAKEWKAFGSYGTIGLEFVLSIMLGLFGGRWLDGRLGTGPWLAIIGFGLGVAAGFKAIHRGWKEMQQITAQEEREEGNPAPVFPKEEPKEDDEAVIERQRGESDDDEKDDRGRGGKADGKD